MNCDCNNPIDLDNLIILLQEAKKMRDIKTQIIMVLMNQLFSDEYFLDNRWSQTDKLKWMNEVKHRLKECLE